MTPTPGAGPPPDEQPLPLDYERPSPAGGRPAGVSMCRRAFALVLAYAAVAAFALGIASANGSALVNGVTFAVTLGTAAVLVRYGNVRL